MSTRSFTTAAIAIAVASALGACSEPRTVRPRPRPSPPPPPSLAVMPGLGTGGGQAPARNPVPLTYEQLRDCSARRVALMGESIRIDRADARISQIRAHLDTEADQLAAERASVDTRFLQQVKDYGRDVESNRRRQQAYNVQVDLFNDDVAAFNAGTRTFDSTCAHRSYWPRDYARLQAETAQQAAAVTPAPLPARPAGTGGTLGASR